MISKDQLSALLWLPVTIVTFTVAAALQRRARNSPMVNPTLLTIIVISLLLRATGTSYAAYEQNVLVLSSLLGISVVALAVPLSQLLRRHGWRVILFLPALLLGVASSIAAAMLVSYKLGASPQMLATAAPRSATLAIAVDVARIAGGVPALTAVLTITTGIVGAVFGPSILDFLGVRSPAARGIAYGASSHAIGTARAFTEDEATGAWSTLALCSAAVVVALFVPFALNWSSSVLK